MRHTTTVVVGAGHSGLAMSRHLAARSIDHVVLERGAVAHSWRTERWDSLRLLTPNWMSRLPGHHYEGGEPDGYMSSAEVIAYLESYGRSFGAPVRGHTRVTGVRPASPGFVVETDQETWRCRAVVVATGAAGDPRVPVVGAELPPAIRQLTALEYRNPAQLGAGDV